MKVLNLIKCQKPIKLINDCDAIVNYKELENAILWYSKSYVTSIKHIYMHGNYPSVSIGKQKIHIHRLLMMYWIGANIPKDFCVHHNNGNKMDAQKENLSLVNSSYHLSKHNKGKKLTEKQIESIIRFNHSRKGKRGNYKRDVSAKQVYDLKMLGYSFNKISIMTKLDWSCVKQRYDDFIRDNPELLEVSYE